MDIEKLDFILNDALNKALMSKDRIKQPNSNNVADFVSKYITDNNQALQLQQTGVIGSFYKECLKCRKSNCINNKTCINCNKEF
jgi:hypothetical protein